MHAVSVSVSNSIDEQTRKLNNYSMCIQYSGLHKSKFNDHVEHSERSLSGDSANQLIIEEQDT